MALTPALQVLGCYAKRCDTRPDSPLAGVPNTAPTVTLRATPIDPLRRATTTIFELDLLAIFNTPDLQVSPGVLGFEALQASWVSTTIPNFIWYWRARSSASIGGVPGVMGSYSRTESFAQAGGAGITRSLYLYENRGIEALSVAARSLYLYENRGIEALSVAARSLYLYETARDGEVFPWLMGINPAEQYRGGQVNLYGDGFGELLEAAASATITTSSVSGGNIGANAVDRTAAEWISTSGAGAWIRFTFGVPKTIVAIALEDLGGGGWGVPLFRFSDGGGDVAGGSVVGAPSTSDEILVGAARTYYALPSPRTVTWIEVRISSGGSGTNRGLREVWIWEDLDATAEGSSAISNLGLGSEVQFGIVAWANRSPGLWPANIGAPIMPAATVTIPSTAESGLVIVRETV